MHIFHTLPVAKLHPFVDRLWGWDYSLPQALPLPSLTPGTGAEMFFHFGQAFRYTRQDDHQARQCASAHLLCMRRETMHLLPSHSDNFIAVRFKIGALHRFTPIPTDLLADQSVPLDTIWGSAIDTLMQRISYAASQHERCMLIQDFLIQRLRSEAIDALVEQALQQLYQDSTTLSIQALADRFALGRRQLERRFQKLTGQTPREIKSAIRFQRSLRELMLQQHAHPTDIALANGYYDQAHFIHEFRQFTRQTPKQYLAEARTKTHFYNTSLSKPGNISSPVELI